MLNVALTGNIAAGKSTLVDWFRDWGATIIDADQLAREAQRPGSEVLAAIALRFGRDVLLEGGELDRAALRGRVMGNDAALQALNAIVHPAVQRRRAELVAEAARRGDLLVVNDIPLLFEAADPGAFDAVVLVDAPAELRARRLVERRGLRAEEARLMIAAQQAAEGKRGRAHLVIDNDGSLDQFRERAQRAWAELRTRAARAAHEPALTRLAALVGPGRRWVASVSGTLARVAASGTPVHLVWGADPPDDEGWERLAAVAQRLGVELLPPEGPAGAREQVRRLRPAAVIAAVAGPAELVLADRGPTLLRPERRRQADVTLDVRPWHSAKRALLAWYPDGPRLEDEDDTERFRDESHPGGSPRTTLLPGAAPA